MVGCKRRKSKTVRPPGRRSMGQPVGNPKDLLCSVTRAKGVGGWVRQNLRGMKGNIVYGKSRWIGMVKERDREKAWGGLPHASYLQEVSHAFVMWCHYQLEKSLATEVNYVTADFFFHRDEWDTYLVTYKMYITCQCTIYSSPNVFASNITT